MCVVPNFDRLSKVGTMHYANPGPNHWQLEKVTILTLSIRQGYCNVNKLGGSHIISIVSGWLILKLANGIIIQRPERV